MFPRIQTMWVWTSIEIGYHVISNNFVGNVFGPIKNLCGVGKIFATFLHIDTLNVVCWIIWFFMVIYGVHGAPYNMLFGAQFFFYFLSL